MLSKEKFLTLSVAVLFTLLMIASCTKKSALSGKWQYNGGIYDGKKQNASPDFKLQREYADTTYEGFMIDGENPPERFNAGKFESTGDSLFVTTNYNSQPSQMLGKTVKFKYKIDGDTLTLNGTLPNGMVVEEYWKKVK